MRQFILTFSCITLLLICGNVHAQNESIFTIPQEQWATRQQAILDANQWERFHYYFVHISD